MRSTEENIHLIDRLVRISGIFCLAVALLLLINYVHIRANKPLESEAMKSLIAQFQADPDSEVLKKEIRSLDLLARKAFFTSNWQIKTGAFLLLIGGIAFATFLRILHTLKAKIAEPLIESTDALTTRKLSQRWILVTGGLLFGAGLAASLLTMDYLKFYQETGTVVQAPAKQEVKIAVVDNGIPAESSDPGIPNEQANLQNQAVEGESAGMPGTTPTGQGTVTPPIDGINQESPANPSQSSPAPTGGGDFRRNHPSFRGPWGQGVSYATGLPTDWDGPSGRNIKWKVALPKKGYNSPVIWGEKLFIAGGDNESRVVYCFNRTDGALLWEHVASEIPGSPATPPKVTSDTGLSAPSVATDGQHVYAIFGTGDIVALDFSGKRLWAKNLTVPDNHYGHSSSLICWKDKVVIQFDTNKGGRLLALNNLSGEIMWDAPRKSKISWSSPMVAEVAGKHQVITTSSPTVAGYDIETGSLIWSLDCLSGEVGPSAAYADGLVYAANEYATLAAIKPGPTPAVVWQADEYLPEAASPAVSEGLLFIATSYGVFVCYDARTGQKLWEKEYPQGFYGSPMIAEGKVYVMDRSGVMHIFKVDRTMTSLGDPVLGEKSVVTPAFANGAIYLRGEKSLFGIGG